ncbi:quinone oxidoreductase family protein [Bacillus suaedaesalsae]|uniref:Quinone oxidoreductase n=1 Tax=Bacillus suaedaesalsae TaxID=2810349 RepID=A0ABS2DK26_9BACI|nr:quinone oxidoreductase [Bacillus suaedaesalsae]MBM6618762.1 quinone oxidoreductase [Bacillus suaedaesalsae]
MKAIVVTEYGGPEVMKYKDVEVPIIQPDQVLIKVDATSVNFADIKSRYGIKGAGKLPFIPGLDAVGVISQVGENVQGLQVGQRVIAFPASGSYAEYIVANEALTFTIPDEIGVETAAACPIVSFLSYKLLADIARIEKGETVLIHAAAGGVGTTAIQLAKLLGAGRVIGTVGSEEKKQVALQSGADHVISYTTEDFAKVVNQLTDGDGVNVILDSIAGEVSEQSMKCLAPYGRLVHFGNSSGKVGKFQTAELHASCRSVLGFSLGSTRSKRLHLLKETAKEVIPLIAEGKLTFHIGGQFDLKEAKQAHELVECRKSTGKVLLKVT